MAIRLGDTAPDFTAETTEGTIEFHKYLGDIVEMREDKNRAYQFLFLSLVAGGFSATISAVQYNVLARIFGH